MYIFSIYGKNDFDKIFKYLTRYTHKYLKIILLNYQNNYVGYSNTDY